MTNDYIERDCTFTHEGHTFESGGAAFNDAYLIAYPSDEVTNHGYALKDWHGNIIGTWRKVSSVASWRMFGRGGSYMGDTYYFMRGKLTDGREYALRGFGVGMVAKGKRVKTSK